MHFALFVFVVVLLALTACLCGATTTASGTEQRARTVTHNKRQISDLKSAGAFGAGRSRLGLGWGRVRSRLGLGWGRVRSRLG